MGMDWEKGPAEKMIVREGRGTKLEEWVGVLITKRRPRTGLGERTNAMQ